MDMTIRRSRRAATGLTAFAASALACITAGHAADPDKAVDKIPTASPIKHVIIIVGENRSFDHLFATYVPKCRRRAGAQPAVRRHHQGRRHAGPELRTRRISSRSSSAPNGGKFFISAGRRSKRSTPTLPRARCRRRAEVRRSPASSTIPGGDPGLPAAGSVPVRHRRHRADLTLGPDTRITNVNSAAARAVPDDRPDHAL